MKDIEWRDGSLPVSTRFDDPYFSREDGRAETDHVFIRGNHLDDRWPEMTQCVIAELGFGTGLNYLETVRQWLALKRSNATLHFISFEQYPMVRKEMERALSNWPELDTLAEPLFSYWETNTDKFELDLDDGVRLTVHFGDANILLPKLSFKADAWFLDGFSPAKNPELWNATLMKEVGSHCVADGTFATYTAAGFVKRNLQDSGFIVTKSPGFGRKRDMLTGIRQCDMDVAVGH
ncbi:MAG: tRNA (5-methylaminomethyl-2-thiouridine)(34)-methyltransferase MnmD [Pseudomonadota bacterium]